MLRKWRLLIPLALFISHAAASQESHVHSAPAKLGKVSFPISCRSAVQEEFNRGVALLHSFAYADAEAAFKNVAAEDPQCAMAHWGVAMSSFHQLWEPPIPASAAPVAAQEIAQARQLKAGTEREMMFVDAASLIFQDAGTLPYSQRALNYEKAMANLAEQNKQDVEAQVFYALALLANASPADKTHQKQKQAVGLLEPLDRAYPEHPAISHYLIHACDNAEMASRALPAARAYARIAPSAPHALHMPSHIFTRLGLWDDSIAANIAAREAARQTGDTGEELHAMDYLVYAYLQTGRDAAAEKVIADLKAMPNLNAGEFKIGYASTAMPVRYAVERQQWAEAAAIRPSSSAPPPVAAIAIWAQGIGLARSGRSADTAPQMDALRKIEEQLQNSGNLYWATQVRVMKREVAAWSAQDQNKGKDAVALLREAADEEDSLEKLPVTPGPILPAREQLGELLLQQDQAELAAKEFRVALTNAPGRRGALRGAAAR